MFNFCLFRSSYKQQSVWKVSGLPGVVVFRFWEHRWCWAWLLCCTLPRRTGRSLWSWEMEPDWRARQWDWSWIRQCSLRLPVGLPHPSPTCLCLRGRTGKALLKYAKCYCHYSFISLHSGWWKGLCTFAHSRLSFEHLKCRIPILIPLQRHLCGISVAHEAVPCSVPDLWLSEPAGRRWGCSPGGQTHLLPGPGPAQVRNCSLNLTSDMFVSGLVSFVAL